MPRKPIFNKVAAIIAERIESGFYATRAFPAERTIAAELGVARTTVRRALQKLVDSADLERDKISGVLIVAPKYKKVFHISILFPSIGSADISHWVGASIKAAKQSNINASVRPIYYHNWSDPVIHDAIDGSDGIFIIPVPDMPNWIKKKIQDSRCRIVSLETDLSSLGVPSLTMFPDHFMSKLLNHIYSCGHRKINCVTQKRDSVIDSRIDFWRSWKRLNGIEGDEFIFDSGEELMQNISKKIKDGKYTCDGVFLCMTHPAAITLACMFARHGIKAGSDVSIASVDGEMQSQDFVPPFASLERADAQPYLQKCIDWMTGASTWQGKLLMEAEEIILHEGESILNAN